MVGPDLSTPSPDTRTSFVGGDPDPLRSSRISNALSFKNATEEVDSEIMLKKNDAWNLKDP